MEVAWWFEIGFLATGTEQSRRGVILFSVSLHQNSYNCVHSMRGDLTTKKLTRNRTCSNENTGGRAFGGIELSAKNETSAHLRRQKGTHTPADTHIHIRGLLRN